MRNASTTSDAVITNVNQPPSWNFKLTVATRIVPVNNRPTPLIRRLRRQRESVARTSHQCLTMPSCDSEKVTKTLIEYSTNKNSTLPCETHNSTSDAIPI